MKTLENLALVPDWKSLARSGEWRIGNTRLETPILFIGYTLRSKPIPWKYCDMDGLLVSAFDIIKKPKEKEEISSMGLESYLSRLDGEGSGIQGKPILLDSGGFSLFNKSRASHADKIDDIFVEYFPEYLSLISGARPTFAVSLDYPIDPTLPEAKIQKRLEVTVDYLGKLEEAEMPADIPIIPVVHPHKGSIRKFLKMAEQFLEQSPVIGIGSLVPLITHRGGSGKDVVKTVKEIRERFSEKLLHVFGIGGATTIHAMISLGADSLDSIGWRKRAAYGIVQLPGAGDRYLVKERRVYMAWKGIRTMSDSERNTFLSCSCPACNGRMNETIWGDLRNWVTTREKQSIRKFKRIAEKVSGETGLLRSEHQRAVLEDLEYMEKWLGVMQEDSLFIKELLLDTEDFSDRICSIKDQALEGKKEPANQYLWIVDKSFNWRAIHNLHVYKQEIGDARQALQSGSYGEFCAKRLEGSRFYRLIGQSVHQSQLD